MKKYLTLFTGLLFSAAAYGQTVVPGSVVGSVGMTHGTTNPTVAEASDFTAVADVAGSLGGTYFKFYDAEDLHCYAPWYDVDNGSTAPTVTGCTVVEVNIAEGDTDATVAGNTRTALNTAPYSTYFAITGATTHVIVTSLTKGEATDGNIGTSGFSVAKTQGVSGSEAIASASVLSNLLGYRICNDAVQTSTWLAVGEGADPEAAGVRLAKDRCLDCPSCTAASLKAVRVSSQAASGAYNVIQFKQ